MADASWTWAVIRDGDELGFDAAAAVARAQQSPRWGWFTVEGTRRGSADVMWLAGSAGADPVGATGAELVDRIAGLGPHDHVVFARDTAEPFRTAVGALHARGEGVPTLEPAAAIVGPDGAPLWRSGGPRVPDVRADGFEPDAVCAFLAPGSPRRVVYFDDQRLRRLNRDSIRRMDRDARQRGLAEALRRIGVEAESETLELLWVGLRPRLATFHDAVSLLSYLAPTWAPPHLAESEGRGLGEIAKALETSGPETGAAAVAVLDRLGGGREGVPRRRRLVRWVLTGQEMAPALHAVWDHLGTAQAISRIRGAAARLSP